MDPEGERHAKEWPLVLTPHTPPPPPHTHTHTTGSSGFCSYSFHDSGHTKITWGKKKREAENAKRREGGEERRGDGKGKGEEGEREEKEV